MVKPNRPAHKYLHIKHIKSIDLKLASLLGCVLWQGTYRIASNFKLLDWNN